MKRSDFWKSKYIKPEDLNSKPVTLVIESVRRETLKANGREEVKPVVYFKGTQQALPLNMTNWDSIADLTQEGDTEKWPGRSVELFQTEVEVQGVMRPCIRIRAPAQADMQLAAKTPNLPPAPKAPPKSDMDDEIPF
jgi:hypothetical protein